MFSKDIILCLKRTIQVLEEQLTFKVRYSLPSNFLWPDSLTLLNSNISFINKLLNQNKRKITLKNNKNQMIRIKRTKTKKSECNESLKVEINEKINFDFTIPFYFLISHFFRWKKKYNFLIIVWLKAQLMNFNLWNHLHVF